MPGKIPQRIKGVPKGLPPEKAASGAGWEPAAYLIAGHNCPDGRDRYRAAKIRNVKTYPVVTCIGYAMWHLPGQAILDAERIMRGDPEPLKARKVR